VLTILIDEHDGGDAFNLHHGPISKSDSPVDVGVELSKNFPDGGHVVRRLAVKDLAAPILLCLVTELGKDLLFDEVHQARC
jgi:hypothetical protein